MRLFNGAVILEKNTYFFKWVIQIEAGDYAFRLNKLRPEYKYSEPLDQTIR